MATLSVVIPTFNRPELLKRSVKSVLAQSEKVDEIIVVDDGSTKRAEDVLTGVNGGRIKVIRHDSNKGLSAARNTGWKHSSSEWVGFLDDDDTWKTDRVGIFLKSLCEAEISACGVEVVSDKGEVCLKRELPGSGLLSRFVSYFGPRTLSSNLIIRRDFLLKTDGYDESLKSFIDHDFILTASKNGAGIKYSEEAGVRQDLYPQKNSIMRDIKTRLSGLEKFLQKWSGYLKTVMAERYNDWLRTYRTDVLYVAAAENLRKLRIGNLIRILPHVFKSEFDWKLLTGRRRSLSGLDLVFHHIPRTGGSTLTPVVIRQYGAGSSYAVSGPDLSRQQGRLFYDGLTDDFRGLFRLIYGHGALDVKKMPQTSRVMLWFRDPVNRVYSMYHSAKMHDKHPMHELANRKSLESILREDLDRWPALKNGQCRSLKSFCGLDAVEAGSAELILNQLLQSRIFCGVFEYFDESLLTASEEFGWKKHLFYKIENKSNKDQHEESCNDLIRSINSEDLLLYRRIRERFEVKLSQKGKSFKIKLMIYRKLNRLAGKLKRSR